MKIQESYNSQMIKQLIRTKFNNQLTHIAQPRCLYADQQILQTLNFAFDHKFTTETRITNAYSLQYDSQAVDIDKASTNVVFLIYPDHNMLNVVGSMIKNNETAFIRKNYSLYFVPSTNYLCTEALQKLNIRNKITIKNFHFDFIPLNQDLLSLQLAPHLDIMEQNQYVVQSLLRMCNITGKFKAFYGLGQRSQVILKRFQKEQEQILSILQNQSNSYLVVLDRKLDYITPMMTAFSYEGLLDLFFGIKFNQIQIPGHLIDSKKTLETFLLYNPKDKHYRQISKMYIRDIPEYLLQKSEQLSKVIKQQKQKAKDLQDLNRINQTLMGQYILLQFHKSIVTFLLTEINQCSFINTATLQSSVIQDCQRAQGIEYLSIFYPIEQVLKLQIMSSQVSEVGSYFSRFEKRIDQLVLQCFHPKHLLTIHKLVENNIIKSTRTPLKWKQMCQRYDLLPDTPHSYTYIHIVYSALLVRFVELFLMDKLNGDMIDLIKTAQSSSGNSNNTRGYCNGKFNKVKTGDKVYIYIVGGITYSQVQCFRILGQKMKLKFTLCTTNMTSGRQIIKKCF